MEPAISFCHAAMKLEWAKMRLHELGARSDAFLKAKPYTVDIMEKPEGGMHILSMGLTRPIPPEIPLAMGDVVSNLRASLDYAWMGLVRAASGDFAPKKTLPIATDRKDLIATIRKAPIGGAAQEAERLLADRIRSHRDFTDGGNEPLVALNELSNWNKHNLLVSHVGETGVRNLRFGDGNTLTLSIEGEAMPVASFSGESATNFVYENEPTFEIIFGEHEFVAGKPVFPILLNMHKAVAEALKAFCQAFPNEGNPIPGDDIRSL